MSEKEQIETVLANIERPSFVTEIRYTLDNDWSGDPAVWIWVVLQDDVTERSEILEYTEPVRSIIVQALREAGIDRWPYLRFRGQSEQGELDREAAWDDETSHQGICLWWPATSASAFAAPGRSR